MAYTFNQINTMLDGGEKSNVFGGDQAGGGQEQAPAGGGQGGASGPEVKSNSESSFTGGSPQATQPASSQQGQPKSSSAQAIVKKAQKSNLDTSGFTKNLSKSIQGAQGQLENEANSFVTNQSARARGPIDRNTLSSAASGDANAYAQTENLIRGPQTQADAFQFGGSTKFKDIDQLATQGGLQESLRSKGKATYNQGQAALDAMLISRDKNYQKNLSEAKAQRDQLRNRQAELEGGTLQQRAQQNITNQESAAREAALRELSGIQSGVTQGAKSRADLYMNYLEQAKNRAPKELEATKQRIRNELMQQNKDTYGINQYLEKADINPADYVSYNQFRGEDDFYNADTAGQYNRIADLLGQGGTRKRATGDLGAYSTIDEARLRQDLMNTAKANQAKDAPSYITGGRSTGSGSPMQQILQNNPYNQIANSIGGTVNDITGGRSDAAINKAKDIQNANVDKVKTSIAKKVGKWK